MSTTANTTDRAAVSARAIKDVMRRGRANTVRPRRAGYTTNLAKAVLSRGDEPHSTCVEKTAVLVRDLARRGALAEAEQIGREYIALARSEYAAAFHDQHTPTFIEAHMAEQQAQGVRELAEAALTHQPCASTVEAFLAASCVHQSAIEQMDDVVRGFRT